MPPAPDGRFPLKLIRMTKITPATPSLFHSSSATFPFASHICASSRNFARVSLGSFSGADYGGLDGVFAGWLMCLQASAAVIERSLLLFSGMRDVYDF